MKVMRDAKPIDALTDYYFGGCEECGRPGALRHVWHQDRTLNMMTCEDCKTGWLIGVGLLTPPDSFWNCSDQEREAAGARFFAEYREVPGDPPGGAMERLRRENIWTA